MATALTRYEALTRCRDAAGSDSQLARDLGVSQPTVWRWMRQSRQMPAEYVLTAEALYGVSRHDLRPDIYPRNHPPAPEEQERWIGIDFAAPGRERAGYVTVSGTGGAR